MSELLLARAAISDLVHTYALNVRSGNGASCAKLFTNDAVFEVRDAPARNPEAEWLTRSRLEGHDAIAAYVARTATPENRVCPLIHNLLIDVRGREATSTCVMISVVWSSGRQLIGEYLDSYRFEDGWRFTSRIFTILGEIGEPHS